MPCFRKKWIRLYIPIALGLLLFPAGSAFPSDDDISYFNIPVGIKHSAGNPEYGGAAVSCLKSEVFRLREDNPGKLFRNPLSDYSAFGSSRTLTEESAFSLSTNADPPFALLSLLNDSNEKLSEDADIPRLQNTGLLKNQNASNFARLKRAELLSLSLQLGGMGVFQALDVWDTEHRPFANAGKNLHRAWTSAPIWDDDAYYYNYIGHPYTGSITYNLMRSQNASPLVSWLFSCSQSLIWEYTLEAMEEHPSIQDLLITSNVGSLAGEGAHRLTGRLRKNGLSLTEKFIILLINPGHVMNNGFR